MKSYWTIGLGAGAGLMLIASAGCRVETDVYVPPPREVVVEEPPPPPPDDGVEVQVDEGPPPPVYEEPPPPPEAGVIWIEGDYVFVGGRYVWHHGHYERPPEGRRHWHRTEWRHSEHGYIRVSGHWE